MKELVLEATDIVDLVGERVTLHRRGRDYVGLCPFHEVVPKKKLFKCFACGAGGDVFKFVMLSQRVEFREALNILAKRAGIALKPETQADRALAAKRDLIRKSLDWARSHFRRELAESDSARAARAYAAHRGLLDETIEKFALGFAADDWSGLITAAGRVGVSRDDLLAAGLVVTSESGRTYDKFRNRLMFPICDGQGRVVAFGGRTLGDDPAKYMNSPETPLFSKSRILYAMDVARQAIEKSRQAIIVEGYVDAVMLHQAGFDNVVATLGTALTEAHVKQLIPAAETIFMCFDGDAAGLKAADRAVEIALSHPADVRVVVLPDDQDPDDLIRAAGPGAFKSLLHSAIGALEFKWNSIRTVVDAGGPAKQKEAIDSFIRFVAQSGLSGHLDETSQAVVIGRISDLLNVPTRLIYEQVATARGASRRTPAAPAPTSSDESDYDESVRGLPGGLVSAVEELFGFVIGAGSLSERADQHLATSVCYCPPWATLLGTIRRLAELSEAWSQEALLASLDAPDICDLVSRTLRRFRSRANYEHCRPDDEQTLHDALCARVAAEMELLRIQNIPSKWRDANATREAQQDAFAAMLRIKQRRSECLPTERILWRMGRR
ncbi:MAG: DNA primase [Planctomycetes bacterium]|nr:DNA primase [Planctomycetota bacterium]